jgi:phospholipid transport system substrate-binding protein
VSGRSKAPGGVARLAAALLAVLPAGPAAGTAATPPDEFVRGEIGALADLLGGGAPDRFDAVRTRIRAIADFDGFARESLGKTWETLTRAEQKRFRDALQRLLESHYMSKPSSIFDEKKASVDGARLDGDDAEVAVTVDRKDVDVAVVVKLRRAGAGWIAEDVVIDGLSLLEDYRAQFRSFLQKRTVRELTARLEARAKAQRAKP